MLQADSSIFIWMPIVGVLFLLFMAGLPLVVGARDERQLRRNRAAQRSAALGAGPAEAAALTEQQAAGSAVPGSVDRDG
jgi:hypothetical protein